MDMDVDRGIKAANGHISAASSKPPPPVSKQKSSTMSSTASVAQQLKNLFGGHSEAKNSFSDVVFDELGVWIPDKVGDTRIKSEEGRHSGLFSFIRRSSLGDKKNGTSVSIHAQMPLVSASSVTPVTTGVPNQQSNNERELFAMLKRVQNRQYDDQRGTSLTAFKEMPDFLKVPGDAKSADEAFSDKIANDNDILQQSQIEVCRRDDNDDDMDGEFACQDIQLSLTPSHVFQPACTFSEEFDSIMPSNDNAEHYFSQSVRVSSPDFNDSRLMECSLRDIGMESPVRGTRRRNGGGGGGWTLIGNVANVGQQLPKGDLAACGDDVFAVPISLPPSSRQHHNSISSVASRQPMKGDATDEIVEKRELESDRDRYFVKHNRPCELDLCNERRRSASNRSTPSPTTHDLLFINGECIVSKAVPYADEDVEFERFEDAADEMYGVV